MKDEEFGGERAGVLRSARMHVTGIPRQQRPFLEPARPPGRAAPDQVGTRRSRWPYGMVTGPYLPADVIAASQDRHRLQTRWPS